MSIQNKKAKYDARQTKAATNRVDSTIIDEQELYIEDRYFIDDIDDIDDNEVAFRNAIKINLSRVFFFQNLSQHWVQSATFLVLFLLEQA